MRKLISTSLLACAFFFSAASLHAQQNAIMIQVLDGYTGVSIARHPVFVSIGATPEEAKARKNILSLWTEQRGILMLPLTNPTGWIQLWTADMHACEPHPEANAFSLAQISTKGLQTPNKCSSLSTQIGPGHFIVYMRELTPAERAATK